MRHSLTNDDHRAQIDAELVGWVGTPHRGARPTDDLDQADPVGLAARIGGSDPPYFNLPTPSRTPSKTAGTDRSEIRGQAILPNHRILPKYARWTSKNASEIYEVSEICCLTLVLIWLGGPEHRTTVRGSPTLDQADLLS